MPRLLQIALLGNPVLHTRAAEVNNPMDSDIQALIDDLFATMTDSDAVGLAAPQVYRSVRLFVMSSRKGVRFPNAPEITPFEVINPEVLSQSTESVSAWEACFSIPGYRAKIVRPHRIRARWIDRDGKMHEQELEDLAARMFLHELDHLRRHNVFGTDGLITRSRFREGDAEIAADLAGTSGTSPLTSAMST
jgi:peptide deformylase